ncbi:hypothetical protein GCM10007301_48030 [Azorhizobium oxalatiphilum]|uniref:Translation initiation factor 2 n=1 Tax=Azorhizobium oxalatiphilum TaxID=980631 RepID=A0A917FG63_9HYPH|nr:translation initiation factor 2 [Azorhizobium oxalatiphilum]GGF82318.1 hypothetical protein GCM10007301_48030 [Azorhizobium oxalatiphilum]
MRLIWAAVAVAFGLSACATVTRDTTATIPVVTEPAGAKVVTSMGFECVSPCAITAGRKDQFTVTITRAGFEPEAIDVITRQSEEGRKALAGNILVGGLIGASMDQANGADLEHVPNAINVALRPIPKRSR